MGILSYLDSVVMPFRIDISDIRKILGEKTRQSRMQDDKMEEKTSIS